ncbi:amino acid ABC transporter permease [uncultured Endozoicomonas sp.]|uniref:amino acid ABC transporter permease n=1 Tax=uncultured Endozoicomonas sp. TaxID=432652 RepID=UPI00260A82D7|nr:amino acid ABC transporter permease [uncultured Endozoicomonas sp.]
MNGKPVKGQPLQMEKQPNQVLWNLVFAALLLLLGLGIYKSSQAIDYIWRWDRIPQYILYQAPEELRAEFDGNIEVDDKGQLTLVNEYDSSEQVSFTDYQEIAVFEGDLIFEGDLLATNYQWQPGPIATGLWMTIKLSLVSIVFAIVLGALAGLARISPNPALRHMATVYVELVRGTPLLVQIFIVYFFIGTVLDLERFTAGVVALSVFTGAYVAEIIRAGIESISRGQMEAGRSLGMSRSMTMRYIILPQAFKRVLPPLAGQFINLIKDSSLVSVISLTDLTKAGREVVSVTFSPFEVWFSIALLYLLLTGTLSWLVRRMEVKYAVRD